MQPKNWHELPLGNDQLVFDSLSTQDILDFCNTRQLSTYAVERILLEKENISYRQGASLPPEAKIMYVIGDQITNDLRKVKKFDGEKLRTKKFDRHFKAPEIGELGIVSIYLDHEGIPLAKVFSEVIDIFYNLFHLIHTDPEFQVKKYTYQDLIESLADALKLDTHQVSQLVIAKYHPRFYNNGGQNADKLEEQYIDELLLQFYGDLETEDNKENVKDCLSHFMERTNVLFNYVLPERLKELGGEEFRRLREMEAIAVLGFEPEL